MTPEQLRASILQQAMEGKLVKQDPNDEPASVLLEKIAKEKARLIKEKKIKRTKKLPEITDDEKPFEIPDSWEWVRIGNLVNIYTGLSYNKSKLQEQSNDMVRVLRGGNINGSNYTVDLYDDDVMIDRKYLAKNNLLLKRGQLLTPSVTSDKQLGKIAIVCDDYNDIVAGGFIFNIVPFIDNEVFSKYFMFVFSSRFIKQQLLNAANKSGQAFYNVSKTKFQKLTLPIPPLAEQKRIVTKLDQLMPLVDKYAEAYDKLKKLDDGFNDKLKQSLLQYAMEGKLVKQDPNDEPASVLLEKIAEEKARLIKEKKIKRTKKLPEITDDEKPFKIPDSWEWVRLGDLSTVLNGDRGKNYPGKRYWINDGVPFVNAGALGSKLINKAALNYISDERFKLLRAGFIKQNDLLYCLRGSLGKIAISNINKGAIASSLAIIRCFDKNMVTYLFWLLKSPISKQYIKKYENGTAQPNLSAKSIEKFEVPLPPLAEQKRIVAKIDQLMATIH